jgi:hypothetical protein
MSLIVTPTDGIDALGDHRHLALRAGDCLIFSWLLRSRSPRWMRASR